MHIFVTGAACGIGAATAARLAAQAQMELRLPTFVGTGHIIHTSILEPLAADIERETGGAAKLPPYPSMQLGGGAPELIRQVQQGSVDIAFSLPG